MSRIVLSPYSVAFWVEYQLDPSRFDYNKIFKNILRGNLDIERLRDALTEFIRNHVLFNRHVADDEGLLYWACNTQIESLTVFQGLDKLNAFIYQPFNLSQGPLYRFGLFQIDQAEYHFVIAFHHILVDGRGMNTVIDCISHYYNNLLSNKKSVEEQIKKIVSWNVKAQKRIDKLDQQVIVDFWKKHISVDAPVWGLPKKLTPYEVDDEIIGVHRFTLDCSILEDDQGQLIYPSTFNVILLAWGVVMARYCNEKSGLLSYPIGIGASDIELGAQVNTLLMPIDFSHQESLDELYQRAMAFVGEMKSVSAQYLPFGEVIRQCDVQIPIVLLSQGAAVERPNLQFSSIDALAVVSSIHVANCSLVMHYTESQGKLIFEIIFNQRYIDGILVKKIHESFEIFLRALMKSSKQPVSSIPLLSQQDYQTIVYDWNKTDAPYPKDKTIHQLFEEQVAKTPDNIALVFEDESMSYQELNAKSNQLARLIRSQYEAIHHKPMQPDTLITLCLERGFNMIIAILAVLKAGGAYVPMDPEFPDARLQFIVQDTQSSLILTQSSLQEKLKQSLFIDMTQDNCQSCQLIFLDEKPYESESQDILSAYSTSTDLAYVIYTSGTTGQPKGVMLENRSLVLRILYMINYSRIICSDKHVFRMNYIFDASVANIFTHLLSGSQLIVTKSLFSTEELKDIFSKYCPTSIHLVPSQYDPLSDLISQSNLKKIYFSGEKLQTEVIDKVGDHIDIYDYYGPTELGEITGNKPRAKRNAIGKIFSENKAYIVDENYNIVPSGVVGELLVSGIGLARGYLNRPEFTKERFIDNPFATPEDIEKGYTRLYKTGDLGRWLPDGNIEYIGRNDFQVKIRGFRIELGEIESALLNIEAIKQSIVLVKTRNLNGEHSQYLVGYYVSDDALADQLILSQLKDTLPDYMMPSLFVHLEALPLTTNGKVDRRALPNPEFKGNQHQYEAPRNRIEEQLCELWQQLLGIEQVGVFDDFFRLGGHSILAIQLVHKIQQVCDKHVAVADIFKYKTIAQLATYLDEPSQSHGFVKCLYRKKDSLSRTLFIHPSQAGLEVYEPILSQLSDHIDMTGIDYAQLLMSEVKVDLYKLAEFYLDAFTDTLPHREALDDRPLHLIGWSMGGHIALEMAVQCENRGMTRVHVTLLDTFVPKSRQVVSHEMIETMRQAQENRLIEKGMDALDRSRYLNLISTEAQLCATPLSEKLKSTQVQLFQAMKRDEKTLSVQIDSLQSFCQAPIKVVAVDACHWDIIDAISSDASLLEVLRLE